MWRSGGSWLLRSRLSPVLGLLGAALLGCAPASSESTAPEPSVDAGSDAGGGAPEVGPRPAACPPGELALEGGGCLGAGVPASACGLGFVPDGNGGCQAELPAEPCGSGELALPGETQCRAVAPCAAGPWGDIPVAASTEFVDGAYGGSDSDGTQAKPWLTVQQGVDAAAPGAIVAVAAGSYAADVLVTGKPVVLWGKCPAEVELVGQASFHGAVTIGTGAGGTEVRGLGLRGADAGLTVHGATGVLAEQLWIHDTGYSGVELEDTDGVTELTLRGALLERTPVAGVYAFGASVTVEDSVIRDPMIDGSGYWGRGISVAEDEATGASAPLTVRRSLIERCSEQGIAAWASPVTVEDTLVRDIQGIVAEGLYGRGIDVRLEPGSLHTPSLVLRRSVVERAHEMGVRLLDGELTVEHSVVRDTAANESDGTFGYGLIAAAYDRPESRPQATIRSSLVERNRVFGIGLVGTDALLEAVVVRDTVPQLDGHFGRGLSIEVNAASGEPSVATVRALVVERAVQVGVELVGSDATFDSVAVRDVEIEPASGWFGRAFSIDVDPITGRRSNAVVRNAAVERCHEIGVAVIGASAELEDISIASMEPRTDGWFGRGIVFQVATETGDRADGRVSHVAVVDSYEAALFVAGATVTIEHALTRGTRPRSGTDDFGDGLIGSVMVRPGQSEPAELEVQDSVLEGSARAGIASFGASVRLRGSRVACNSIDLDGELFAGTSFEFQDLGANWCGCEASERACQAMSSGLAPPEPAAE